MKKEKYYIFESVIDDLLRVSVSVSLYLILLQAVTALKEELCWGLSSMGNQIYFTFNFPKVPHCLMLLMTKRSSRFNLDGRYAIPRIALLSFLVFLSVWWFHERACSLFLKFLPKLTWISYLHCQLLLKWRLISN